MEMQSHEVSKAQLEKIISYLEKTQRTEVTIKSAKIFPDLGGKDYHVGVYEAELRSGKKVFLVDTGSNTRKTYEYEFPSLEIAGKTHCCWLFKRHQLSQGHEDFWQAKINALKLPDKYKELIKQEFPEHVWVTYNPLDAYDLIIAVLALKPKYSKGFQQDDFCKNLLEQYSEEHEPIFREAQIRPHQTHSDSLTLQRALDTLVLNGVLKRWVPGGDYTWDFPSSPEDYFEKHIKPRLDQRQASFLKKLARSMK